MLEVRFRGCNSQTDTCQGEAGGAFMSSLKDCTNFSMVRLENTVKQN
jgi:hypothetical protein